MCVHQLTKCQYSSVYQLDISPDQSVCPPDSRRVGHALQLRACCRVTCILTPVLISSTVMRSSTSRFTACHHDMDNISTHCSVDSSNHFPFTARQTDRQTDRQPHQPATFFLSLTTVASEFESAVVKLLSKRWWIPIGARLEGLKLEPEGPGAEGGVPDRRPGVFEHSRLLWQLNSV